MGFWEALLITLLCWSDGGRIREKQVKDLEAMMLVVAGCPHESRIFVECAIGTSMIQFKISPPTLFIHAVS
jgi:hypothetical protein